jgi:hypothetical protein
MFFIRGLYLGKEEKPYKLDDGKTGTSRRILIKDQKGIEVKTVNVDESVFQRLDSMKVMQPIEMEIDIRDFQGRLSFKGK